MREIRVVKTIELNENETEVQSHLWSGKSIEDCGRTEKVLTLTYTLAEPLDWQIDLNVYNAPEEDGGPWVDPVLFDSGGYEACVSEVGDSLFGEYHFFVDDLAIVFELQEITND